MNLDIMNYDWNQLTESFTIASLKLTAIIVIFLIVKGITKKIIHKTFNNILNRKAISQGRARTLESLTVNVINYVLIFILVVMILGTFNIEVMPILAGAGIVGLAVAFGAQGLVSDVVTGFFLLLEKQIDVEDYITAAGFSGIVEEVGLKTTKIRGFDGTLHYVPNRDITSLSNHSRGIMRALVDMSISYDANVDEVISLLQEACNQFAKENEAIKDGPNVLGVQTFGASDVVIRVIAKTENMKQFEVERNLRKYLKSILDQNGIEIPFPHQVYIERKEQ